MTDQDLFFTHTVVGPAMSIELGRRLNKRDLSGRAAKQALAANMATATFDVPQVWKDWCLIQGAYPYAGRPRQRPGRARRWLERHALVLAFVSLLLLVFLLSFTVMWVWFPHVLESVVGLPRAPGFVLR